ncbi:hypothetical protein A3Q56_02360, partial [Intoshia linei]
MSNPFNKDAGIFNSAKSVKKAASTNPFGSEIKLEKVPKEKDKIHIKNPFERIMKHKKESSLTLTKNKLKEDTKTIIPEPKKSIKMSETVIDLRPSIVQVTPNDGIPGITISLDGENLGEDKNDIFMVLFGDQDLTYWTTWISPNELKIRMGSKIGTATFIVVTRKGGMGVSKCEFTCESIRSNPFEESSVWLNESIYLNDLMNSNFNIATTTEIENENPLNIDQNSPNEFVQNILTKFRKSASFTSEKFDPIYYLLNSHSLCDFKTLQSGLKNLVNEIDQQSEVPFMFLKSHVSHFMESLNVLKNLVDSHQLNQTLINLKHIKNLKSSLKETSNAAHDMFNSVLKRSEMAQSTWNALNVIQRHSFLFNLTNNINKYIVNKNYDMVITDFNRAASLFQNSKVEFIRRVFEIIRQKIIQLCQDIISQLQDSSNQKFDKNYQLIKVLESLNYPYNCAWIYFESLAKSVKLKLKQDFDGYLEFIKFENDKYQDFIEYNDAETYKVDDNHFTKTNEYFKSVCEILALYMINLWKIGENYFYYDSQITKHNSESALNDKSSLTNGNVSKNNLSRNNSNYSNVKFSIFDNKAATKDESKIVLTGTVKANYQDPGKYEEFMEYIMELIQIFYDDVSSVFQFKKDINDKEKSNITITICSLLDSVNIF